MSVTLKVRGLRLADAAAPKLFQSATRGSSGGDDNVFLPRDYIEVREAIDLSSAARSGAGRVPREVEAGDDEVLILEMADGVTVVTTAAKLAAAMERIDPSAFEDGKLVLRAALRDRTTAVRGTIGEGVEALFTKIFRTVVGAAVDPIVESARKELAKTLGTDDVDGQIGVSWLGTKALMHAIESRLDREPGLYRWVNAELGDVFDDDDERLAADAKEGPLLVFVHGTGSNTAGSFQELQIASRSYWQAFERTYGDRIYALEHRTLSESPIENALALAKVLPRGARVHLVTHSRGGLVGDLLCIDPKAPDLVSAYALDDRMLGEKDPDARAQLVADLERAHDEQRTALAALAALLAKKGIRVERYVRVACPARGTRLAGGNIDVFLSGLLTLIGWIPQLAANPVYWAFKRAVLEIVKNRTKPQLVPGIEAMLPNSPLGRFLEAARPLDGVEVGVISGDTQGENFLARLGLFFTDFMFDRENNDLVVDTDSMSGGIARPANARVLFDQGQEVTHFGYFSNQETRTALADWLIEPDLAAVGGFARLPEAEPELGADDQRAADRALVRSRGSDGSAVPTVVVLPGIMGSHLAIGGTDRVWFSPTDLAVGALRKIRWDASDVGPETLFAMFYGRISRHLLATHDVVRFPYDWRLPLDVLADRLAERLRPLLQSKRAPIRFLAHSMGGLVVRALAAKHPDVWDEAMRRRDARFVMLGTPNQGSYAMVEALIGKSDMIRSLAVLDLTQSMQEILDLVGEFRGALQLLPRPGFKEAADDQAGDLYRADTWVALKREMRDFWFDDEVAATPSADALSEGAWLWSNDRALAAHADKIAYVHGCAESTPCGMKKIGGRWKMLGTARGDGSVTWASGAIDGIGHRFWMPAEHGALADTEEYFDSVVEILERGRGGRLSTTAPQTRDRSGPIAYDAGPPIRRSSAEVAGALLGRTRRICRSPRRRSVLKVRVVAMDLRGVEQPIMVGHYDEDPLMGTELLVDRTLVGGELRMRYDLGMYPGAIGTALAVLKGQTPEERASYRYRGAVVTGLGKYDGRLTVPDLTTAVRTGVLRYLLHVRDGTNGGGDTHELTLSSLLLGFRSAAQFTIVDSVGAVIRGVIEANRKFAEQERIADRSRAQVRVAELDLVELYLDTAISATYAAQRVAEVINADPRTDVTVQVEPRLVQLDGTRQRLEASSVTAFWPRLIITNDDDPATQTSGIAEKLRFLHVGQRARAETVVVQRQPGLVEKLVAAQIPIRKYNEDFSRSLFQMLVPHDFKAAARQLDRVVFVVDGYTSNLPWELMLADDAPLATKVMMVRQLSSTSFRPRVAQSLERRAYVIGNPSTDGFYAEFPGNTPNPPPEGLALDSLDGAEAEAVAVADILTQQRYEVERAIGAGYPAIDVITRLYRRPYRILHISAHGVFEEIAKDGKPRTGVVLSDGQLITAAEIQSMESVPELVFLSCCHLGKDDGGANRKVAFNKLASSVARELIEMGVRAVIAAGWAVADDSARLFGETFYEALLAEGVGFGEAVFRARKKTWAAFPNEITWGAFQAYGDPEWRLGQESRTAKPDARAPDFVATEELIAAIANMRNDVRRSGAPTLQEARRKEHDAKALVRRAHPDWLARADVSAQLGDLYCELGLDDKARDHYERAIATEAEAGRMPIRAIEQLAKLEKTAGEQKGEAALIKRAIARLEAVDGALTAGDRKKKPHPERAKLIEEAHASLDRVQGARAEAAIDAANAAAPAAGDGE
jgi:CHAT domain-containing protein/pimeloyl-ACP methyl ester carboxylesterase